MLLEPCCALKYFPDIEVFRNSINGNLYVFPKLQDTGRPKKMLLLSSFDFLTLGGVLLGVKNNSRNFGNKINKRFLSKI